MENKGLVSVIIPVYNVRPYIEEALDSVLAQSYKDLEILVIDDGSTDGSGEVCDRYAEKDERIRVFHQANRIVGAARNVGLDRMTGEMVAFLDPDDAYHPSFIEEMVFAMEREKVDVVICRYTVQKTVGELNYTEGERTYPLIAQGRYDRAGALSALVKGLINTSVWNKLYRRELWEELRFVEGYVYEDNVPTYKVFSLSQNNYVLNRTLYLHRERPGSITATVSQSNLADQLLSCSQVFAFVQDNTPRLFTPQQLKLVCQSYLNGMMSGYIRYCGKYRGDAFAKEARRQIIVFGRKIGIDNVKFRMRVAYCMLCFCPWLLRLLYPVYHSIRMEILRFTGR